LSNPATARRCVCGTGLVPDWQLQEEKQERQFARRRKLDSLWQVLSVGALVAVLYAAWLFAERF